MKTYFRNIVGKMFFISSVGMILSGCVPILIAMGAATAVVYEDELLDPDSWPASIKPKLSKPSAQPEIEASEDSAQLANQKTMNSLVPSAQGRKNAAVKRYESAGIETMPIAKDEPKIALIPEGKPKHRKKLDRKTTGFTGREQKLLEESDAALVHKGQSKSEISTKHLLGLDRSSVAKLVGSPSILRNEAPGEIWLYKGKRCVMHLFLYASGNLKEYRVKHVEYRSNSSTTVDEEKCLHSFLDRSNVLVN